MTQINVIGGGLAGLVAAISCAEQGASVHLFEAHDELGGRARSMDGPYKANLGPHAILASSPLWSWLGDRDLLIASDSKGAVRLRSLHDPSRQPSALVGGRDGMGAVAPEPGGDHLFTVDAWGANESGQLGTGDNQESVVPLAVKGLTGATAIAAGKEHALALLSNGTVKAWGNNEDGQLGDQGQARDSRCKVI